MLSIDDAAIDQKIRQINATKADFRQAKDRRNAFERVLRDHYEHLHTAQSLPQEYIAQSLRALHGALNAPELVDQQLLIDFISVIIRFVENAGLGYGFSRAFMDRAITIYQQAGFSPIDLYLEKASLLRLEQLESTEREMALLEARRYAEASQDSDALVRVLMSCAVYYTEVSQYQKALQACQTCEQLIQHDSQLQKYTPKLLTLFGMNYTPLFRYQLAKSYLLRAKAQLEAERVGQKGTQHDEMAVSTMETIYHYLARIDEAEGNVLEAMCNYIEGFRYQQMFREKSISREAFYHLRLGELLTSASLLEQARDHLHNGQALFDTIQYSSSGRLQVSLAWATLYSKEGNYSRAREYILAAREEAKDKHFSRGELMCLVKLFWLELGHLHLLRAITTFLQAMSTWRNGELRRNEGFRLFGNYLMQVVSTPLKLLRRTPHTVMGAGTFNAVLTTCICPIHQPDSEVEGRADHV